MHFLVTGATGFIGGHVVKRLLKDGHSVRALVLPSEGADELSSSGIEIYRADLADGGNLDAAVAGIDVVIHCAGLVGLTWTYDDMRRVNVEGTERLLAACKGQPLSRFVYLSSVAVYGHAPVPVVEDAPKRPIAAYGRSKWEAEQVIWRYHSQHGVPAVALRPAIIYGPKDTNGWNLLALLFNQRVLPLPSGGKRLLDLVYISDVVEAILAAATLPAAVGHAYNITDGQAHSYRDLLLAYEQVSGRRPPIVPIPGAAMVTALQLIFRLQQARGVPGDWVGQLDRVRGINTDIHYAIDAARRDLQYVPNVPPSDGFRRTLSGNSSPTPVE